MNKRTHLPNGILPKSDFGIEMEHRTSAALAYFSLEG